MPQRGDFLILPTKGADFLRESAPFLGLRVFRSSNGWAAPRTPMTRILPFLFSSFALPLILSSEAQEPVPRGPVARTWDEAYDRLKPILDTPLEETPKSEIEGKVVTGYQGWFGAEGDGSGLGWKHYGGRDFGPGHCTFDLWPDMAESDPDERYPTPFRHPDGSAAALFSSYHPKTVDRHFKWMKQHGIDGVMLQRFGASLRSPEQHDFGTAVMQNVRNGASRHQRSWAMMYDLSGMDAEEVLPIISEDWKRLVDRAQIRKDPAYLHHRGKPLVAVWGVGFNDNRRYGIKECSQLVDFLKNDPTYGGNAVMLGIPYYWRDQQRDATDDPGLHALLKTADILSPWSVGRYRNTDAVDRHVPARIAADIAWCGQAGPSYLPVIFPGFSWQNLEKSRGREAPLNDIDREDGRFLWQQAVEAKRAGSTMIYVAMFDEVDEATAIFKASNTPPVGLSNFVTYGNRTPDHYLWLTGAIGRMLRGPMPDDSGMPSR